MSKTKDEEKIKVPFWLHIVGFLIYLVFIIAINLNGVMIFRIGGIIILFFMFKYAIDEFRRAKKENKDPYLAYFFSELLMLIGFSVFATLFADMDWYSKIIFIILFAVLGALIYGVLKISEIINKKSKSGAIAFMISGIIVLLLAFSGTVYLLSSEPIDYSYAPEVNEQDYIGFETYSDEYITIKYPEYMTPTEPTQDFVYKVFKTDYENQDDSFQDNLIVIISSADGLSLDEATELSMQGLEENNFVKISEEETTLLNEKAKKVIYTYDYSIENVDHNFKVIMINTVFDDLFVSLQFTAEQDNFNQYLPDVNKMIDSFWVY
jgi:hypothetical protein